MGVTTMLAGVRRGGGRRTARAMRAGTAAALAVLLIAGCTGRPNTAAVVDGRRISESELDRTVRELGPMLSTSAPRDVLVALVVGPTFAQVAADHGVGVSDDDARALLDTVAESSGVTAPASYGDGSLLVARYSQAVTNIQSLEDATDVLADANARVQGLDLDLNPRYGSLDLATGATSDADMPWIVDATPKQ